MSTGTLFLIPSPLGEGDSAFVLPEQCRQIAADLDTFVVEEPKTARRILKQFGVKTPLQALHFFTLNEHTKPAELDPMLAPLLSGHDVGLLSEAGCPGVADPGAMLVRRAHEKHVRVVPLVGPSSILLALMASGLNGQRFAFHGYLPVDKAERAKRIKELERLSESRDETQAFIEAPYRNQRLLEDLVQTGDNATELCIATDLTLPTEAIATRRIADWRKQLPDIGKKPTVFLLYRRKK